MGYVGRQPDRDSKIVDMDYLRHALRDLIEISSEMDVSVESVIELYKVLEMQRSNAIAVQDGDYRDEHIAGICDRLMEIAEAIKPTDAD